jgi:hypothetical protein
MTAVLASPRFLFRMEETLPENEPKAHPLLDEFALASRLSYFLWSTMPDEQLDQLARKGELRENLSAQVQRMLEASEKTPDGNDRTLREALELHREQPLCSSCHNRMDPLGLALENFNAMGLWRDQERGQILQPAGGKLITGEPFADVRELKRLLVTARRTDYYRCLTEKLLTYALGRGPEPCDITAVDGIVAQLETSHGKFSTLITGVIDSTPFQKRRRTTP